MGADGGSIPKRSELVKTTKTTTIDPTALQLRQSLRWMQCSLTGEPLIEPVVADYLGRLYNKDALIMAILEKKRNHRRDEEKFDDSLELSPGSYLVEHIKSAKDFVTLRLNGRASPDGGSLFTCPITRKQPVAKKGNISSGIHGEDCTAAFYFHPSCGCVASATGLKELNIIPTKKLEASVLTNEVECSDILSSDAEMRCPVCEIEIFGDWIILNGSPEEQEALRKKLKVKKSSLKRTHKILAKDEPDSKRIKHIPK